MTKPLDERSLCNTPRVIEGNKYTGFDPLMVDGDCMSLRTLKRCYRKHVRLDDSIGWDKLSDELVDCLAQIMGDKEFIKWLEDID
jgi:hypothetical protein